MLAFIHKILYDLVVETNGLEKWNEIREEAGLSHTDTEEFCDTDNHGKVYEDEIIWKIVKIASRILGWEIGFDWHGFTLMNILKHQTASFNLVQFASFLIFHDLPIKAVNEICALNKMITNQLASHAPKPCSPKRIRACL